jgi:hypothetical protein
VGQSNHSSTRWRDGPLQPNDSASAKFFRPRHFWPLKFTGLIHHFILNCLTTVNLIVFYFNLSVCFDH